MTITKNLNILVDLTTFYELRDLSRESDTSYSHIVRTALNQYLEKAKGLKRENKQHRDGQPA